MASVPLQAALQSHHGLETRFADRRELVRTALKQAAPNQVRTSDLTYLCTDEGRLRLAIVRDLFNRELIVWSFGGAAGRRKFFYLPYESFFC